MKTPNSNVKTPSRRGHCLKKHTERQRKRRSSFSPKSPTRLLRLHPLFLLVGVWYAFTGELFIFLLSALIAIQHECAHAFAAYKLGYRLNAIVLMPFGAVIDGDLKGISFKDEIYVAFCGPLCNLLTALLFVALWWFQPTMYAFTDTVVYSSLSVALVNLLPAYPLDGGRVLYCCLANSFSKKQLTPAKAEEKAKKFCFLITILFAVFFLLFFLLQCLQKQPNFSLLAFGLFLLAGAFGNKKKDAVYEKIDFSFLPPLKKGVEIRRVAILADSPIKDLFPFLSRGSFLVFEVYDRQAHLLFELPQTHLSRFFSEAETPYESLLSLWKRTQKTKN